MLHIAMAHKQLVAVLLCAAAAATMTLGAAAAADVDTFSFPAFNATTMRNMFAATNSSVLVGAYLLFERDQAFAATNRSEGFLLLPDRIDLWRARDGAGAGVGVPDREASFNSTFTLSGSAAVAFVVLKDSFPPLNSPGGLRGNRTAFVPEGSASAAGLADLEAGAVRSYGADDPAVGLNVTVTPTGTAAASSSRTVWVEYDAAAHRLFVYVAAAGQARPGRAAIDAALNLAAGGRTTETANVGFFAARISDIIDGVSGWELTVDALPGKNDGNREKEASWMTILVAVLLSVAATAAM